MAEPRGIIKSMLDEAVKKREKKERKLEDDPFHAEYTLRDLARHQSQHEALDAISEGKATEPNDVLKILDNDFDRI